MNSSLRVGGQGRRRYRADGRPASDVIPKMIDDENSEIIYRIADRISYCIKISNEAKKRVRRVGL